MSARLLVAAGEDMGISPTATSRIVREMAGRIDAKAAAVLATMEAENQVLLAARPELGATLTGEDRCVRAIVHIVIREMSTKLRQPD